MKACEKDKILFNANATKRLLRNLKIVVEDYHFYSKEYLVEIVNATTQELEKIFHETSDCLNINDD